MSATSSKSTVLTPRLRTTAKRGLFWVIAGIVLILFAIITANITSSNASKEALDPESPYEPGTQALVEVLRDQGVKVIITTSLDDTRAAVKAAGNSTLFFSNLKGYLSKNQLSEASALAETVIFAAPDFSELLEIAPEVAHAGTGVNKVPASCSASITSRAPQITTGPTSYRVIEPSSDITACYGNEESGYGLIVIDRAENELRILGASDALTNGQIINADNAAFALRLLGENNTLIWYTPSLLDLPTDASTPTPAELMPQWVQPGVWLLLLTIITLAIWRGRRFGPLVIEKLPVTVRSSETMQGRARLYAKFVARLHTLDSLRIGSIRRLSTICGMPSTASVDDVINRVSSLTGHPIAMLRQLLLDEAPGSDHNLIRLSDQLLELEERVEAIVRPTSTFKSINPRIEKNRK